MKNRERSAAVLRLLLVGWLIFASGKAYGQSTWVSIGPEGGKVGRFFQDPTNPNTIYIVSGEYPAAIYKSTNKGGTWIPFSKITNWVLSFACNPKKISEWYAGSYSQFMRSTDNGITWNTYNQTTGRYFYDIAVDSSSQDLLHACGSGDRGGGVWAMGYYKSTDRGTTWTSSFISVSSGTGSAIKVDPKNAKAIYVGGYVQEGSFNNGKVYKTTNGGANWSDVTGIITGIVYDILVDSTNVKRVFVLTGDGVFLSTNNGMSWSRNNGWMYGYKLAHDPKNKNILYAGGSNDVFKSTDGGTNWTRYTTGLTNAQCTNLAVDLGNSSNVFFSNGTGYFVSTNGGTSWNAFNSGLILSDITALGYASGAASALYAAVNNIGLFKTNNPLAKTGQANAVVWQTMTKFWDPSNIKLTDLKISPANPNILFASDYGT